MDGIKKITGVSPEFVKLDLRDKKEVNRLFEACPDLSGIIHFAACKAVGESIDQPLKYYENNIGALILYFKPLKVKEKGFHLYSVPLYCIWSSRQASHN